MSIPESPNPPHLYPQEIQVKLYQAFIFSIPILFSIILLLLFYLFYLKRRFSRTPSSSPPVLPTTLHRAATHISSPCQNGLEGDVRDKYPIIVVDEVSREVSLCCVCLRKFKIKEKLLEVPTCKHMFHVECIHHWLQTNATYPLCRRLVVPITKVQDTMSPATEGHQDERNTDNNQVLHTLSPGSQEREQPHAGTNDPELSREANIP